jgi:hypothetical protein
LAARLQKVTGARIAELARLANDWPDARRCSVADLQSAIAQFLDTWNESPKPFVWTATVQSIQDKLSRCRQTLEQIKPGCTAPRSRKIKSPVISRTPQ